MNNIFPRLLANESIKNLLGEDIRNGKHSHAYIIDGPDGSGKHTTALQIAAAILCHNKEGSTLPCGCCPSCKKIDAGYATAIEFVNRGDEASLKVQPIREVLSKVSYMPEDGDYKIYIIEEAEKMTDQAQNALLLTLEEPPRHAVFILLTADSDALLETIRSRAHTLKTEQLSASVILQALYRLRRDNVIGENDDEKLKTAASAAMGCLGNAIVMCDKNSSSALLKCRETADKLTRALLFSGSAEAISFCRSLTLTRAEYESVLFYAMTAVRDYISIKSGSKHTISCSDTDAAAKEAMSTPLTRLFNVYRLLEAAQDDICRRNASASTVLCSLAANAWKENR